MKHIHYSLFAILLSLLLMACTETVSDARQEKGLPMIYPGYLGVTIPVNMAPLNFCMADETALRIDAVITDRHGHSLHSQGEESTDFDLADWHTLLGQNRGDSISVTVSAKYEDGWHAYRPFSIYISPDSIDYGICYRLIEPGYEVWSKMGIYERDLSSFEERPLIENTQFEVFVTSMPRALSPRPLCCHSGIHVVSIARVSFPSTYPISSLAQPALIAIRPVAPSMMSLVQTLEYVSILVCNHRISVASASSIITSGSSIIFGSSITSGSDSGVCTGFTSGSGSGSISGSGSASASF